MKDKKLFLIDFFFINLGLFLTGYGLCNFLVPAKLAAGGVSGLSTIIYYLFSIPVGWSMFIINIPIFILGISTFGKSYALKSIYGIVMLSTYSNLVQSHLVFEKFATLAANNQAIGSALGGITIGLGLGFALGFGSNTGGTAIVAQVLNKHFKLKVGTCLMIADAIVVSIAAMVFDIKSALLAGISLLLMGQVINFMVAFVQKTRFDNKESNVSAQH